jgi:pimeloyl-ACP methyl ester carboxylesterase
VVAAVVVRVLRLALLLTLVACTPTRGTSPDTHSDIDQTIQVNQTKLRLKCVGTGQPVIIEAGLGEPPIESDTWKQVITALSSQARLCVYDRAGLGSSDTAKNQPRRLADISADLHTLLVNAQLQGPFILVGHSFGGLIVRSFASQHPDQVKAIVLVDATHPDQWQRWLANLPPHISAEPKSVSAARTTLQSQLNDPKTNSEQIDLSRLAADAQTFAPLGATPLIVLTHSPNWRMVPDLPAAVQDKLEKVSQSLQKDLLTLSTQSEQRISLNGGHYLHVEDPELVIQAIRDVLAR